jgi:hypothetical protein
MLPHLLNRFRAIAATPARRARARRWRPLLEALEDRLAPAVFNPLSLADSTSGNTLRAAVIAANGNGQDNTINLQAGHYNLTIPNTSGHEGAARQGDLNLTAAGHTLVIQGAGPDVTVIDANEIDRAFQVSAGVTVVFRDLSIVNGTAVDDGTDGALPGTTDARGGAILCDGGNVTLDHVLLAYNAALGGVGGHPAEGGGIWAHRGTLTIENSTLEHNFAMGGSGASGGADGGAADGGALFALNTMVTIVNSTFSNNLARGGTGSAGSSGTFGSPGGRGGPGYGAGLWLYGGPVQVSASALVDNVAVGGNGGAGGNGSQTGGDGGDAGPSGGAGIFAVIGPVSLSNSTVGENKSSGGTGGAGGTGKASSGGAGGAGGSANGAGILLGLAPMDLHNSTIARNGASESQGGGGGSGNTPGTPGSVGTSQGGNISADSKSTVNVVSTIIAGGQANTAPDFSGAFATASHNLLQDGSGATGISNGVNGNLVGIDPKLRPLDNYGGPTETFALYADSPAIEAGSNPDGLTTDQRGFGPRNLNGTDIGAFEFGATPPAPSLPPGGVLVHLISVHPLKLHGRTWLEVFDAASGTLKAKVLPFSKPRVKVQWLTADVNGDGYADVIAFAVINGTLRLRMFSGLNLAPM